jgi:hypothetical protein
MKFLVLLALLPLIASAQTLTSTAPKCTAVTTITCQPVTVTLPSSTSTTPTPTPVPTGTFSVYSNGVFNWAGDFSWNASINYKDTVGKPGALDIAVSITSAYGGFQPYAQGGAFDTSPYKYLQYCAKPTRSGQVFGMGFAAAGDVGDGGIVNIGAGTAYGPSPTAGQWGCYKIPLADFKLTNPSILKFSVADGSGAATNTYYIDSIAFTN